jgi:heme/copper-type cytochrome/quinol oxidase subunit 2
MNKIVTISSILMLFVANTYSQCAMCRGAAETSLEAGNTQAAGINTGVLYVLVIVTIILSSFAYVVWKHRNADGKYN